MIISRLLSLFVLAAAMAMTAGVLMLVRPDFDTGDEAETACSSCDARHANMQKRREAIQALRQQDGQ